MFAAVSDHTTDQQVDAASLGDDELSARLRELELEHRRREADIVVLVAEAERRRLGAADGHRTIRNYLRAELNWSPLQIVRRRRLAALFDLVPDTHAALRDGRIGIAQADELARARSNPRCGDLLADSAALLIEFCEQHDYDTARAFITGWEIRADLDGAHRNRHASQERRRAFVTELDGGVHVEASGGSSLDAAELVAIFDAFVEAEFRNDVAERTERCGPDADGPLRRTDAQRRFDALQAIFRSAAANPAWAPAIPMLLNIVVDDTTFRHELARHGLATLPDAGVPDPAAGRCESDSGIQLHPDDALRAALDGHIRRIVIDSSGVVTDVGRKRRLFTGVMRDIAKLLAHRCIAPGCTVRARFAQIDHLAEWDADNGPTSLVNAAVTCGHHNRVKHRNQLRVRRRPDGQVNWFRPDGTVIAPVGRPHVPDNDEIDTIIRRRIDDLAAERQRET